ncbi:MAG TPA: hypothetical protein VK968_14840 [Roseimicrobium sp.]|nr:hypothetical protein [Roseimicrobium sp.]
MSLTVSNSATMQGSFTNYGTGETGMVVGATNPDGGFNMTFTPNGGAATNINGVMARDSGSRGGLAADGTWTRPGVPALAFTFDLESDNPVEHPLAGPYNGIWEVSGTTDTGIWNITIGQNGALAGSFTNSGTGIGGRIEGNVLLDGSFVGAMVENGTGTRYELQGVMSKNGETGLAADGTFTRPGGQPEGFTFTSEIPEGT